MRVRCFHGFFLFEETRVGQVSDYVSLTGLKIVPFGRLFTFEGLAEAKDYSLKGADLLGFTAVKTFEGKPWEVFEANGVVYDFTTGSVRLISSVTQRTKIQLAGNRYVSPGLILPGSIDQDGDRVRDFSGWFSFDRGTWLYSEVSYV